jgi:hypothetical protein
MRITHPAGRRSTPGGNRRYRDRMYGGLLKSAGVV